MDDVAVDIIGPVPESSDGFRFILTLLCLFTRFAHAIPLRSVSAVAVARALLEHFFSIFGLPKRILSDRGPQFQRSTVFREVSKLLGVKNLFTSDYHPQTNGACERFNRTLVNILAVATVDSPRDWPKHLPFALWAYRSSVHRSTGETPFRMMFHFDCRLPVDILYNLEMPTPQAPFGQEIVDSIQRMFANAEKEQKKVQLQNSRLIDRCRHAVEFQPRQLVLVYEAERLKRQRANKWAFKWSGPFRVLEKLTPLTYRVRHIHNFEVKVVNVQRMLAYEHGMPTSATEILDLPFEAQLRTIASEGKDQKEVDAASFDEIAHVPSHSSESSVSEGESHEQVGASDPSSPSGTPASPPVPPTSSLDRVGVLSSEGRV
jgi:hypothetical protein